MELTGNRTIAAPRETVWAALNDPDVLRDCIPGCTDLTGSAEDGFQATVKQKVGPVSATFKGEVTVEDAIPLERYRLSGAGKGGVAGFAKGHADVVLTDVPDGTELSYAVNAKVGGKIAQLGSRVVDSFAAKMADAFFERFKDRVEAG
ncbi:carbon monoxide dehydrogenase subunit G [Jannaschia sp. LMIT008]|uniref:CoxG family protein n=1 Tax=Jannaschia maritima TaxID=3032585 RepID=UPI002811E569|nr:carbon monoxide dehydrogenase subunit G [Jannaschia sp. LMIT008]